MNQGHPLALGGLTTHNKKEKHNTKDKGNLFRTLHQKQFYLIKALDFWIKSTRVSFCKAQGIEM